MTPWWYYFGGIVVLCVIVSGCTSTTPQSSTAAMPAPDTPPVTAPAISKVPGTGAFFLEAAGLGAGEALPAAYTCTGAGESPEIRWTGIPADTKSLVLILDDPDAPSGTFTHWIVYNIPSETRELARAQPLAKTLANGAQQGDTSAGSRGYFPPCPPVGQEHRYIFRLYALDTGISMPTADRAGIDAAMSGHIIENTEMVTTFRR